jgi:hypothetical protein
MCLCALSSSTRRQGAESVQIMVVALRIRTRRSRTNLHKRHVYTDGVGGEFHALVSPALHRFRDQKVSGQAWRCQKCKQASHHSKHPHRGLRFPGLVTEKCCSRHAVKTAHSVAGSVLEATQPKPSAAEAKRSVDSKSVTTQHLLKETSKLKRSLQEKLHGVLSDEHRLRPHTNSSLSNVNKTLQGRNRHLILCFQSQ